MLEASMADPANAARIDRVPTASAAVVRLACPATVVAVPSLLVPFVNVTREPSGTDAPVAVTAAVNVTGWPMNEGFKEEVTVMVVENFARICSESVADVLD
jgi:hypothetical protein